MISGKVASDNVTGFDVISDSDDTDITLHDGECVIAVRLTIDAARDLATAIQASLNEPNTRITPGRVRDERPVP